LKLPEAIQADRLTIRPFKRDDLPGFISFMTGETTTRHLMFTEDQKTVDGARTLLESIISSYASESPVFACAITLKGDDSFIGSCGISPISDEVFECYYSLLPSHWGNGYATEALKALLDYCFQDDSVKEVRAYVSPENHRSARVAERAGMAYMGIQPHPIWENEGRLYSTTREQCSSV